eukprot:6489388-Heterocapsa_arctica.AAC.1
MSCAAWLIFQCTKYNHNALAPLTTQRAWEPWGQPGSFRLTTIAPYEGKAESVGSIRTSIHGCMPC